MKKLFGTDGIRGIVNQTLTGDLAYKVGLATAKLLRTNHFRDVTDSPFKDDKPVVLIGTDTRPSKDLIFSGLSCGLCAGGVNVVSVGILPTPAVAYLTKGYSFVSAGIIVTASHNPKEYNGIKIIGPDGYKLPDLLEEQIEELILKISDETISGFFVEAPGRISYEYVEPAKKDYMDFLAIEFGSLGGRIAVDCSNGAASACKDIFYNLGLDADIYNVDFSGEHINDGCGSTHLEFLQNKVKNSLYSCGIAFDGDADRCLLVDETGDIVDGDHILAIVGSYMKQQGKLKNNTIVGTIMSNLGLVKFCESNGIKFLATKVGDKYVLEEMILSECNLGGEESGHIIFKDYATTGDGILTALMVLNIMYKTHMSLSELKKQLFKYPQVTSKIAASPKQKNAFIANTALKYAIENMVETTLAGDGRAVIRPSGTENCIKIMVEGTNQILITELRNKIENLIKMNLN